MPFPTLRITLATASLAGLALSGCGGSATEDVHSAPRETQTWENVDLAGKNAAQLLAHLDTLAAAAQSASAAGAYVEFHHIEVAMTPTLDALSTKVAGNAAALATIESIKPLATKLHIAGHDGNVSQGAKLSDAISKLVTQLSKQLN